MLNAMGQGNDGSMSTIHARSARDVFNRIASYALQSVEHLPHAASYQLVAGGLEYVVFISRHPKVPGPSRSSEGPQLTIDHEKAHVGDLTGRLRAKESLSFAGLPLLGEVAPTKSPVAEGNTSRATRDTSMDWPSLIWLGPALDLDRGSQVRGCGHSSCAGVQQPRRSYGPPGDPVSP
jgi:hypothetical protein